MSAYLVQHGQEEIMVRRQRCLQRLQDSGSRVNLLPATQSAPNGLFHYWTARYSALGSSRVGDQLVDETRSLVSSPSARQSEDAQPDVDAVTESLVFILGK